MTPEQEKAFLELVSTASLYEEFKRRFDHCVAAGLMKRPTPDDAEHYLMSYTYIGAPLLCQGLALQLIHKCQRDADAMMQEKDVDDL